MTFSTDSATAPTAAPTAAPAAAPAAVSTAAPTAVPTAVPSGQPAPAGKADGAPGLPPAVAAVVTAIDHVGIAVADLDAAVAFYAQAFGMRCVHTEVNEEQGVREAMLAVGDSGSFIQLLEPLHADTTIGRFLAAKGPGIQQMAYRVADLDAASVTLRAAGVRLLYDTPRRGTAGSRVNFVHPKSAGGVLVELVEPAADPAH